MGVGRGDFGGLPDLLALYGNSGQFWPDVDELLGPEVLTPIVTLHKQLDILLERFIDALRQRPLTVEILAWETVDRAELTTVLETVREEWGRELGERLSRNYPNVQFDVTALMIIFTASIQYLMVRARTIRVYGGIDLHLPEGWARIHSAMAAALGCVLSGNVRSNPSA